MDNHELHELGNIPHPLTVHNQGGLHLQTTPRGKNVKKEQHTPSEFLLDPRYILGLVKYEHPLELQVPLIRPHPHPTLLNLIYNSSQFQKYNAMHTFVTLR